jgi:hypothetical protein
MATTTVTAIYTAFREKILSLDPDGKAHGGAAEFRYAAPGFSWGDMPRAESDWDRRFTVDNLRRGKPIGFGIQAHRQYQGTIQVTIGHFVTDDEHEGQVRRDADLHQIAEELEKKSNFPSGVSPVRLANQVTVKLGGKFWRTVLTFRLQYYLAAP